MRKQRKYSYDLKYHHISGRGSEHKGKCLVFGGGRIARYGWKVRKPRPAERQPRADEPGDAAAEEGQPGLRIRALMF